MNSVKQFKHQFGLYAGAIIGNANFKQVFFDFFFVICF